MLMPILPESKHLSHALLGVIASWLSAIIDHVKLLKEASHVQQNMCIFHTLLIAFG